jgi:hypothetical protein
MKLMTPVSKSTCESEDAITPGSLPNKVKSHEQHLYYTPQTQSSRRKTKAARWLSSTAQRSENKGYNFRDSFTSPDCAFDSPSSVLTFQDLASKYDSPIIIPALESQLQAAPLLNENKGEVKENYNTILFWDLLSNHLKLPL